jgi:hypothetical protein
VTEEIALSKKIRIRTQEEQAVKTNSTVKTNNILATASLNICFSLISNYRVNY